ncbi:hypothetical protein ES288_A13G060800v1 [Gossypium darwinii]|uniref:AB hydrolase-1 domain-containing protein n=1 Tax=Gossypium darwinii TaxID=34276 RepID=A0A5D2DWP2_GOSDA|nr:hypothetical protein ES288_A13G060800v1 [Gossypium darwinii]
MEKVQHNHVQAKELKLHVTQIGTSPKVVLFLHGLPEIWYSWRHQMIAVDNAGYRAISIDSTSCCQGFRGLRIAAMVGKLHPHRVSTIVLLGAQLPLIPPSFYMLRWMVPGRAEADFGRFDTKIVMRKVYTMFSGSLPQVAVDDQEILDLVDSSAPLPPWLSEEDLPEYGSLYEKSGFRTALQVPYRTMMQSCRLDDGKIRVPGLVIMVEQDYIMKFTGLEDYIRTGKVKEFAPNLDVTFLAQGNHFVQEQLPEEMNHLIISFLIKHCK